MKAKKAKVIKGMFVRMVNCIEADIYSNKIWLTTSEPWNACCTRLIKLEGFAGGFDVDCLEEVKHE